MRSSDSTSSERSLQATRIGTLVACLALACAACDAGPPPPVLDLPPRPPAAPGGEELAREIAGLDLAAREARIYEEVARGNLPTWLRELRPVRLQGGAGGREREVLFWVTPDYLSVGSDDDYLLVPLSPPTAQRIADLVDASLPTPAMVDAVWLAADRRLAPQRLAPADSVQSLRTVDYYERHTNVIGGQRMLKGVRRDALVAGHKKDVVLSPEVQANPGKVAIYGMHEPDGTPTQRLSTAAAQTTVYYNHGVRLVHRRVVVDGVERELADLLRDPELAPVLSRAGPIAEPRYPTSGLRQAPARPPTGTPPPGS